MNSNVKSDIWLRNRSSSPSLLFFSSSLLHTNLDFLWPKNSWKFGDIAKICDQCVLLRLRTSSPSLPCSLSNCDRLPNMTTWPDLTVRITAARSLSLSPSLSLPLPPTDLPFYCVAAGIADTRVSIVAPIQGPVDNRDPTRPTSSSIFEAPLATMEDSMTDASFRSAMSAASEGENPSIPVWLTKDKGFCCSRLDARFCWQMVWIAASNFFYLFSCIGRSAFNVLSMERCSGWVFQLLVCSFHVILMIWIMHPVNQILVCNSNQNYYVVS